jgi:hypothetical protein
MFASPNILRTGVHRGVGGALYMRITLKKYLRKKIELLYTLRALRALSTLSTLRSRRTLRTKSTLRRV